jgi:hypothetical protein
MALTGSSALGVNVLAKYIEKKIREYLIESLMLPAMVTFSSLEGIQSKVDSFPKWPSLVAAAVAETADLANTTLTTTADDLTVSEVGINIELTKLGSRSTGINLDDIAQRGGLAVKRKLETDLAALFTGFSGRVGSTGTDLTLDKLSDAISTLDMNNAGVDKVVVLHPRQVKTLRKLIMGTSGATGTIFGTGIVNPLYTQIPGFVFDWGGVPIFQSTLVPTANAGVDYVGAAFTMKALGLTMKWDVEVEMEPNASQRSTECVVTACYGAGELEDAAGIGILTVVA